MANRIAFQTQLASIMEVLANAAVAEICKLVDDDYAVISLQMTQCQRENKALKRKLHIMELKMARSHAERRTGSLNRANRVQVNAALSEKYRNQTNVVYAAPFNTRMWRGGGTDATVPQHLTTPVTKNNNTAEDPVISEVDTVLIKEEMFEENQTQQRLFISDGLTQTLQAKEADLGDPKDDDQVSGMQRHTLEVSGSDTLKSEPEFDSVKGIFQEPIELHAEAKFELNGKSSPMKEYLMQGSDNVDLRQPSCAYVSNARAAESQSAGPVRHSEVIEVDSADEEEEEVSVWANKTARGKSQASFVYPHYGMEEHQDSRAFMPSSNPPLVSSDFVEVASTSSKIQEIPDVGLDQQRACRTKNEKLFACTYCGKVFNRPKKVVIHQRIHTGEKPFKCNTCGKLFAEAGNLKKHQKVHTRERPCSCSLCGKTFAWTRNFKIHQKKCHSFMLLTDEQVPLGGAIN